MAYTVSIKESAQRELEEIPRYERGRVEDKIASLADNPRPSGTKPLKGKRFKGLYRVRSGDYRIIYQVKDSPSYSVLVVNIGNRKDVYD